MPPSLSTARQAGRNRKTSWARKPAALAERLEQAHVLDPVIRRLSDGVVRALPAGSKTDALHGVPFGQPAHPALVRLPLGCWTSAVLLDLFRGTDRATRMLIGAGVAVTVPAAATGLADWSALHQDQQRMFQYPSEIGDDTLKAAVRIMLSSPRGQVAYHFAGTSRTAIFSQSDLTGWRFVLVRIDR